MASDKHHLRRDRRMMAGLIAIAAACTGLLGWRVGFHEPALALPTREVETTSSGGPVQIVFGGDTMLADAQVADMGYGRGDEVLAGVKPLLAGADEVVINAEAPISARTDGGDRGAKYTYSVLPSDADALARAGVTILNLGNNHSMDRGPHGLADTISWAKSHGISTVGAGQDRSDAEEPLILDTPYGKLAIVSFGENFGPDSRSTESSPGIVQFSPDRIIRGMTLAKRAGAEYIIAFVHWGDNYAPINDQQRYWAGQLADAGYDLVIGSGSHTLQGVERVKGVPVVYGIGNLVFGSNGRYDVYGAVGLSVVARLAWKPGTDPQLTLTCVQADNSVTSYVTRVCTPEEGTVASSILGSEVGWDGVSGVLAL